MNGDTLYADPKLAAYRRGDAPLPSSYWLWPLYGAGLENLGRDEQPIQVPTPACGPDQLLVRHDAVGLCFSDTKVIKAGETHPRLGGRDMKANPVVLGHEVALTVLRVGDNLKDRYQPGQRFIIQADIYYKGVGLAYGYVLQGGLSQYNVVGPEVLDGDEGSYLLPMQLQTGYAQAALTEPWACVVASYTVEYRSGWKPGGVALIVAGPGAKDGYKLGTPYSGGQPPAKIVAVGVGGTLQAELRRRAASDGYTLVEIEGAPLDEQMLARVRQANDGQGYDDIVMLGPDAALYEALEPLAGKGCTLNLVGAEALAGPAQVDAGRLHYDALSLSGTAGGEIAAAYAPVRTELKAGGRAAMLGAAGPMGQMHFQRALQADPGPAMLIATDLVAERLEELNIKFGQLIGDKSATCQTLLKTPEAGQSGAAFNESLKALTGGQGFDDIVVLAPSGGVVAGAVGMMAPGGVINVFAGLAIGTRASIDLSAVVNRGVRFTGTSGSSISDLRGMLAQAESGQLDPNLSVVAVSGLKDAKKGLEGVVHQGFPGKVVIYPQLLDFPLTRLQDLESVLPAVAAKLGPNHSWTVEAEAEFLKELLP